MLVTAAKERAQRDLLARGDEDADLHREALQAGADNLLAEGSTIVLMEDLIAAAPRAEALEKRGELNEEAVARLLRENKVADALVAIGRLAKMEPELMGQAYNAPHFDPLLFVVQGRALRLADLQAAARRESGQEPARSPCSRRPSPASRRSARRRPSASCASWWPSRRWPSPDAAGRPVRHVRACCRDNCIVFRLRRLEVRRALDVARSKSDPLAMSAAPATRILICARPPRRSTPSATPRRCAASPTCSCATASACATSTSPSSTKSSACSPRASRRMRAPSSPSGWPMSRTRRRASCAGSRATRSSSARPILSRSPRLTDDDLVDVALAMGRNHMIAITERDSLSRGGDGRARRARRPGRRSTRRSATRAPASPSPATGGSCRARATTRRCRSCWASGPTFRCTGSRS